MGALDDRAADGGTQQTPFQFLDTIERLSAAARRDGLQVNVGVNVLDRLVEIGRAGLAGEQLKIVRHFIDERGEYITACKNTPGDGDQADYYRWLGHAGARRQLATALGMDVPGGGI